MKKILLCFILLLSCFVLFILPSFCAYIPTFDFDVLQQNPDYFGYSEQFSVGDSSEQDNWITYYSDFESYTYTSSHTEYLPILVVWLDVDFNIITIDFHITVHEDGVYLTSVSLNSSALNFTLGEGRSFNDCSLTFSPDSLTSPARYLSVIALPGDVNSAASQNVINQVYSSTFAITAYESGYLAGVQSGEGYLDGYYRGLGSADNRYYSEGYDKGYYKGFDDGSSDGYKNGYDEGYRSAEVDDVTQDIKGLIFFTLSAPFQAITNALNFEFLGINLAGLFGFILTAILLVFILKHFI